MIDGRPVETVAPPGQPRGVSIDDKPAGSAASRASTAAAEPESSVSAVPAGTPWDREAT